MIKWALGVLGVLVGVAVTVRIGKREAARLLEAMAATDGSDEVGTLNGRVSASYLRAMNQPIDRDPINGYSRYGYLQGKPGAVTFDNCYFEEEELAVRRARQHIEARRAPIADM